MTKRSQSAKRVGRAPRVRDSAGTLHPFLRGMVTHDLMQRGLSFEEAYAAARALRDQAAERDEISTHDLNELIQAHLERTLSAERLATLRASATPPPDLIVTYAQQPPLPFSRGLLAQSLYAIGLDFDRAYRLVVELLGELHDAKVSRIESRELARWVGDLLERWEGETTAGRYRLMRRIRHLPHPLVIYLGGATGTGKSTMSLALAPLLRIFRINATDTIREVMRMVFSPAILPSLHRSSFEMGSRFDALPELGRASLGEEPRSELIAAFEEQAVRVCVGVRAVVERSLAENVSILVEGVHLLPSVVPFSDLEGAAYQVILALTTVDEEVHRGRFLARDQLGKRRSEHYLENFASIRLLQTHLLQLAEEHDVPLLDTTDRESVPRALSLVTGILQQRLPWLAKSAEGDTRSLIPSLLLVIDGLSDHPVRALGGRTPLQAAHTPTLDRLAAEGVSGLADPVASGVVPDTASGNLAVFGQSPHTMQRGPIEALGAGIELEPNDIALRGNFATLDPEGRIEDRRAGRIRDDAVELAAALDQLSLPEAEFEGVSIRVRPATEHRLAIVLRGEGLSSAIVGSDPGDAAPPGPPLEPRASEPGDEAAERTARLLSVFEREARRLLKDHPVNQRRVDAQLPSANAVITRGAGRVHQLRALEPGGHQLRIACVSGDSTVLGLADFLGAEVITGDGMTANVDTDLRAKFDAAREALAHSDLVVLHLKGADVAAHDRRADLKVEFLERTDEELARLLRHTEGELRVAVTSDHTTLSELGHHTADPVPVLIWGTDVEGDEVEAFDELAVGTGRLGRFPLELLVERLFAPVG